MFIYNKADNEILNRVRYDGTLNPFSHKFKKAANDKLLASAKSQEVSENIVNIVRSAPYFHQKFFLPLTAALNAIYKQIGLSKFDLIELYVAYINQQFGLIQQKFNEYLIGREKYSAFEANNSTFTLSSNPNNPQGFVSNAEALTDHLNELLNYLLSPYCPEQVSNKRGRHMEIIEGLAVLKHIVNQYWGIKNHYETVLYYLGDIEIEDGKNLFFNAVLTDLNAAQVTSVTAIHNQRLKKRMVLERLYKEDYNMRKSLGQMNFKKKIDLVSQTQGFLTYKLRQRKDNDVTSLIDMILAGEDYYPFYLNEPLAKLGGLTIKELIRLHLELNALILAYTNGSLQEYKFSIANYAAAFAPRIKRSVLVSYLANVTRYAKFKIEKFINITTTIAGRGIDVYATPLISNNDFYIFPFLPIERPNYYFLIDFWLTEAGIDLDHRGIEFEKYCKSRLLNIKQTSFNKFKVINQKKFQCGDKWEEIDLFIETERSIIIAELKCVKYPMNERDHYSTLADVIAEKACRQIVRKADFLTTHKNEFSNVVNLNDKKLIKLIITNFPVFAGLKVEDIPTTDIVTFLSYFTTNSMTGIIENGDSFEKVILSYYYQNEAEFCNNLEDYICNNPLTKEIAKDLIVKENSYQFDENTHIRNTTITADPQTFNLLIPDQPSTTN